MNLHPNVCRLPSLLISANLIFCSLTEHIFAEREAFVLERTEAKFIEAIAPPLQSPKTREIRFVGPLAESSLFSSVRFSLLGNPSGVNDFLFLFHGDTPSYYDTTTKAGKSATPIEADLWRLHQELSKVGEGLVVVQAKSSKQDWHSLYRTSQSDFRANGLAIEIQVLYLALCKYFPGERRCHFHSFSGAGRVDRALHKALLEGEETFPELRSGALQSWTVSDGMVNNAFSKEDKLEKKSVMAVSWANFMQRYPAISVTLVYDRSGEYPYMQGINLDVIRFSRDLAETGRIGVEPSVKIIGQAGALRTVNVDGSKVLKQLQAFEKKRDVVRLKSANNHLNTFLGEIADSYLEHRKGLRGGR